MTRLAAFLKARGLDAFFGALALLTFTLLGLAISLPFFALTFGVLGVATAGRGVSEEEFQSMFYWACAVIWFLMSATFLGYYARKPRATERVGVSS
jgi:hypothetical protein